MTRMLKCLCKVMCALLALSFSSNSYALCRLPAKSTPNELADYIFRNSDYVGIFQVEKQASKENLVLRPLLLVKGDSSKKFLSLQNWDGHNQTTFDNALNISQGNIGQILFLMLLENRDKVKGSECGQAALGKDKRGDVLRLFINNNYTPVSKR